MRLSVVIPVYNERATVRAIVTAVLAAPPAGLDKEILIVDDGSTDGTREILRELDGRDGVRVFLQNVPAIRIGGQLTKSPYQFVLQSSSTETLYQWAPQIERKLRSLPGLVDLSSDLQIARPQVTVEIDRPKASAMGVSAQQVEMARLKGLRPAIVIWRHALPNAWAPIVTIVALYLAYLIAGVVVVEVVFVYPGIGQLMVDAVTTRDVPVVQACALIFATVYILLNLFADIVGIVTNPRLLHP